MKISPKIVQCFEDSVGNKHTSRLAYLLAEKRLTLRGIIQSDEVHGKSNSFTSTQVADLVANNAEKMIEAVRAFNKAINKERSKANPIDTKGN